MWLCGVPYEIQIALVWKWPPARLLDNPRTGYKSDQVFIVPLGVLRMSRLRSNKGCWTCRLRRKKCDERHPVCQLCHTLAIPCYGYGPKPDWMDGGDIEKSRIQSLKQTVRYTSRKRDRSRPQQPRFQKQAIPSSSQLDAVNDTANGVVDITTSDSQKEESPPSEPSLPLLQTSITPPDQTNPMLSMGDLSPSDTRRLMHFVDHVYPLQLPISQTSVIRHDRNWLLPVIMHIRPFYHSVLGLTALHQGLLEGLFMSQSKDEAKKLRLLKYAHKHHSLCLQDLQAAIQLLGPYKPKGSECLKGGVGVLACVLQLVLLEVVQDFPISYGLPTKYCFARCAPTRQITGRSI